MDCPEVESTSVAAAVSYKYWYWLDDGLVGKLVPKWTEAATDDPDGNFPSYCQYQGFSLPDLWSFNPPTVLTHGPDFDTTVCILEAFLLQEVPTRHVFFGLSLLHTGSVSFVAASH